MQHAGLAVVTQTEQGGERVNSFPVWQGSRFEYGSKIDSQRRQGRAKGRRLYHECAHTKARVGGLQHRSEFVDHVRAPKACDSGRIGIACAKPWIGPREPSERA